MACISLWCIHHRIAHRLCTLGAPMLARIVAMLAYAQTGIDIHPDAQAAAGFFIDHGTGVVTCETADERRNETSFKHSAASLRSRPCAPTRRFGTGENTPLAEVDQLQEPLHPGGQGDAG